MSTTPDSQGAPLRPLPRNTTVPVSGISHTQDQARRVNIGDRVILTHDTANPYDADAVVITTLDRAHLGYVPATNKLNSRLLVGHRGGVWGGIVVDKVGIETVGLRIKIVTLLDHRPAAFGSSLPGVRGDVTEPTVDISSPAEIHPTRNPTTPVIGDPGAVPAADQVWTKGSHRLLGEYLETTGSRVRVRAADGTVASYPAAVVQIGHPVAS